MQQELTKRAQIVMQLAQEEAKAVGRSLAVGPEYLLLGLLKERDCLAVRILERLGVVPEKIAAVIEDEIGRAKADTVEGAALPPQHALPEPGLTPSAKSVLDLAREEARLLGNNYIGTEHLLLGMIRQGNAIPARILAHHEITLERVRDEVRNPLLNMDETARFLGISKPTLYRLLNQGELKGLKAGRQWRFNKWDLIAYTQRSPIASSAPANAVDAERAYFEAELKKAGGEAPTADPEIMDERERNIALLIRLVVGLAIHQRASDIHMEPVRQDGQSSLRLRFRVDGVLQEIRRLPMSLHESLFLFAKQWAGMDMAEKALPQNGRVPLLHEHKEFDIRIATLPSLYGETLVVRILDRGKLLVPLERLGVFPSDFAQIRDWLKQANGLIITSGPSGSGKTTTLYGMLDMLDRPLSKLMTVEDPVGITLQDAIQTSINKKAGLTYPIALRAILQQDPDIVMIGDLYDQDSAEIALEMAVTGHLIFTQLNFNTVAEAVHHLVELSDNPLLVAQTLIGVAAQRLARRICGNCKQEVSHDQDSQLLAHCRDLAEQGGFTMPPSFTLYRGSGCPNCRHTGYRGRIALYEVLSSAPPLGDAILRRASAKEYNELAVAAGMTTLFADGLRKVVEGQTTLEEVLRVAKTTLA